MKSIFDCNYVFVIEEAREAFPSTYTFLDFQPIHPTQFPTQPTLVWHLYIYFPEFPCCFRFWLSSLGIIRVSLSASLTLCLTLSFFLCLFRLNILNIIRMSLWRVPWGSPHLIDCKFAALQTLQLLIKIKLKESKKLLVKEEGKAR